LLKGETFSLIDAEVDKSDANATESSHGQLGSKSIFRRIGIPSPDEENLGTKITIAKLVIETVVSQVGFSYAFPGPGLTCFESVQLALGITKRRAVSYGGGEIAYHVWGRICDSPVEQPVGSGGEG